MSPYLAVFGRRLNNQPPLFRFGVLTLLLLMGTLIFLTISSYTRDPRIKPRPVLQNAQGYLLPSQPAPSAPGLCEKYPDPGNIAIIVKTSAPELAQRLPTILVTSLACVKTPLLFSDLETWLGGHRVHDIVTNPPPSPEKPDQAAGSQMYDKQQRLLKSGREPELPLLQTLLAGSSELRAAAEELDRLKFLRMLGKAWELQPGKEWYVFLETDVYLAWPNLLEWLGGLEVGGKQFWGAVGRDSEFLIKKGVGANLSGALVFSGEVVRAWSEAGTDAMSYWESKVEKSVSGEDLLAAALKKVLGVTMGNAGDVISAHSPNLIPFTPATWCAPLLSIHNTTNRDQNTLHQAQASKPSFRLLHHDTFTLFHPNNLPFELEAHDNLSDDPIHRLSTPDTNPKARDGRQTLEYYREPNKRLEACRLACQVMERCRQFSFLEESVRVGGGREEKKEQCFLSSAWRLGLERKAARGVAWTSGWTASIAGYVEGHERCELDL